MVKKQFSPTWIMVWITLLIPQGSFTQNAISLFDYLSSYDDLEVTIEASFKGIAKKNDKYMPAHLIIRSGDALLLDTMGEIRSRGNARKIICTMPPTKIRIDKGYLQSKGWLDYPTLKIVNPCSYTDQAESYISIENVIYEIYNLLTEKSYRTRSVSLKYIDSDGKKKPTSFEGFLIEHEDQLAARMHGEIINQDYFNPKYLERRNYLVFTMFQFLIGNTDWKVLNKHNLLLFKVASERTSYAVPFDFDYAGLVNASYAVPNEQLPIKSIRERMYLGPCQTEEELAENRNLFSSKKEAVFTLIGDADLSEKQKGLCTAYMNKFYEIIEDEKQAKKTFTTCVDY